MKVINIKRDTILEQQYAINEVKRFNEENNYKYHINTFGCQMNEHDSEKMEAMLLLMGFVKAKDENNADFILFNTCAVRENAELKVYGNIGRIKKLKEDRDIILAISGCMMQQPHVIQKLKKSFRVVDIIFGTHNYHNLPIYIYDNLFENKKVVQVMDDSKVIIENLPVKRKAGVKAFVNIMQGCNNFCTFCIVPHTRGREKSRKYEDIINEIKLLVKNGVKEVTLLGQNVNSYSGGVNFATLLRKVNEIEGLLRIRFMTSHPKDISDEVIKCFKDLDKLCEYLHLPVQSGSNRILKKMNRRYTKEKYLNIIEKLKEYVPDIALSTDLIIGFPSETQDDVLETIDLIKKVKYDSAFTFIYSKRENTPAAKMQDDVNDKTKHKRFQMMLDELNEIVIRKNKERLNNVYEVLFESKQDDLYIGRSRENFLIKVVSKKDLLNKVFNVKITKTNKFSLEGVICK